MAKLKVWLTAETKQFQKSMRRADRTIAKFSKTAYRGLAVAGAAAAGVAYKSLQAYDKEAQSLAKLQSTLKATGYAAGLSQKELTDHAAALQRQTKFGNESTQAFQALLLTFKDVKGDQFKRATELGLDLSEALGQDMKTSAIQLGKALNDPIRGVTALRRVGVSFTDQQQEQIKALQESGRITEAQTLILNELESQFGGTAAAAAKAGLGPFTQFKNAVSDNMEVIGEFIAELVKSEGSTKGITDKLLDFAETAKTKIPEAVYYTKVVLNEVRTALENSWDTARIFVHNSISAFKGFGAAIGITAANIYTNFEEVFNWFFRNWKTLLKNVHKLSGDTWLAIGKQVLLSMTLPLRAAAKAFQDFYTAAKKRDFKSIIEAASPADDFAEAFRDVTANVGDIFDKVSDDLGIAAPKIRDTMTGALDQLLDPSKYESVTDAIEKNEAQKLARLAKIEEGYQNALLKREEDRRKAAMVKTAADAANMAQTLEFKASSDIADQYLRIGAIMGERMMEASPEREMRKQTSIQERIAAGIDRMNERFKPMQPRFV